MHVKEAQRTLGSEITWLCDTMTNDLKHALGNAPNAEFVIDPDGKVVRRRLWSEPDDLRDDLIELVGPVANPTQVADLNMKSLVSDDPAPSGVVPRIDMPGRMQAVKIEPKENGEPFYVKLRAEVDRSYEDTKQGKMYLGFHLDPLYHVHWNNLVAPVQYEITAPAGVEITPASASAPNVEAPSDIDPREFIVDIHQTSDSNEPIMLTVKYFACNDAEGWCKPVTQQYAVYLDEVDRDGGSARRGGQGMQRGGRGQQPGGRGGQQPGGRGGGRGPAQMLERFDLNGDGTIAADELSAMPDRPRQFMLDRYDANKDGVLTKEELEAGGAPGSPGSPGAGSGRGGRGGGGGQRGGGRGGGGGGA